MTFESPMFLWLFLIYVPLIVWYIKKHRTSSATLEISSVESLSRMPKSYKEYLVHLLFVLRLLTIGAIIICLCRPQTPDSQQKSRIEGTDIVISMDISGSMLSQDFSPNRFEAAKKVATKFINGRQNDNIGLVVFAGESFSLMPLTNDRAALINTVTNIRMDMLTDGTAVGDGLVSAINRVSSGKAKSKSIILLTDGTNNAGDVPPQTAAKIAKQKGVRVYTIGVGTNGVIQIPDPFGFMTQMETKIDEQSLTNIAQQTGGQYFRAYDEDMLDDIFNEIDKLEKTKLDVQQYTQTDEDYMRWAWLALILFVIEIVLRYTVLRRIP